VTEKGRERAPNRKTPSTGRTSSQLIGMADACVFDKFLKYPVGIGLCDMLLIDSLCAGISVSPSKIANTVVAKADCSSPQGKYDNEFFCYAAYRVSCSDSTTPAKADCSSPDGLYDNEDEDVLPISPITEKSFDVHEFADFEGMSMTQDDYVVTAEYRGGPSPGLISKSPIACIAPNKRVNETDIPYISSPEYDASRYPCDNDDGDISVDYLARLTGGLVLTTKYGDNHDDNDTLDSEYTSRFGDWFNKVAVDAADIVSKLMSVCADDIREEEKHVCCVI
jgi:hypothetical protein